MRAGIYQALAKGKGMQRSEYFSFHPIDKPSMIASIAMLSLLHISNATCHCHAMHDMVLGLHCKDARQLDAAALSYTGCPSEVAEGGNTSEAES